jgi:hypothetical protein
MHSFVSQAVPLLQQDDPESSEIPTYENFTWKQFLPLSCGPGVGSAAGLINPGALQTEAHQNKLQWLRIAWIWPHPLLLTLHTHTPWPPESISISELESFLEPVGFRYVILFISCILILFAPLNSKVTKPGQGGPWTDHLSYHLLDICENTSISYSHS